MNVIEVKSLQKRYYWHVAVEDVSFEVFRWRRHRLTGPDLWVASERGGGRRCTCWCVAACV